MIDLSKEIEEIKENLLQLTALFLSQKTVLNFNEFCSYAGISKSYAYKLTSEGRVPHFKPNGKMVYFKRLEIDNWLLQNPIRTQKEIEQNATDYVTLNRKGGVKC
jgi:excisionase family DNA binding protein